MQPNIKIVPRRSASSFVYVGCSLDVVGVGAGAVFDDDQGRGLSAPGMRMGSRKPLLFCKKSAETSSGGMRANVSGVNSMSPFLKAAM